MKQILVLGGGPAGLTGALELLRNDATATVIVVEQEEQVGGISRTIRYKGNRMDIGGHRFFSKSDRIMDWWKMILPVADSGNIRSDNDVMLIRKRVSRIFHLGKFFDYPVSLSWSTLKNLGLRRTSAMGATYVHACLFPIKPEKSLKDFFVNRFGSKLYETFFRDYTEKVWGIPCEEISADWGAQRVKKLSIIRIIRHAILSLFSGKSRDVSQKETDTGLIEQFMYPKFGPGHLWEKAAGMIEKLGGTVLLRHRVKGVEMKDGAVCGIVVRNLETDETTRIPCDSVISSLPLEELAPMLATSSAKVRAICRGLPYRDFITVGVLCRCLRVASSPIDDNWIYIQEPNVHMGRIQIFNNWSPWLVADPDTVWLGLEYFASEGDALWNLSESAFIDLAVTELASMNFIRREDVLDATMLKIKKAYPAYFGSYREIGVVQDYLNGIPNLYPVGRNGMHRYNNMDHSMLSAMQAVACILDSTQDKSAIWKINEEREYHESK